MDPVHKKTTRRSNTRPNVWRASPTSFGLALPVPFEETVERIEDPEVCSSSGEPERWLEAESCLRPLRRGRSHTLIATRKEENDHKKLSRVWPSCKPLRCCFFFLSRQPTVTAYPFRASLPPPLTPSRRHQAAKSTGTWL